MSKLFALSAYVAVMSFAAIGEGGTSAARHAAPGALEKSDCARASCAGSGAAETAALSRTGPNETTAARSLAR